MPMGTPYAQRSVADWPPMRKGILFCLVDASIHLIHGFYTSLRMEAKVRLCPAGIASKGFGRSAMLKVEENLIKVVDIV
jgi:hypothetical protein